MGLEVLADLLIGVYPPFIEGVIPLLETDFREFMLYENLKISGKRGEEVFYDLNTILVISMMLRNL